jgi:hypothetical protein
VSASLVFFFLFFFFYKGAAHFFGVRYTQHLKPFYLFFRVEGGEVVVGYNMRWRAVD